MISAPTVNAALPTSPARAAFELGPREAVAGCVCVHGFSGSPFEVRPLGEALAARGLHVVGPVLPGHAHGDPRELDQTTWADWYGAVCEAFEAEHRRFGRVAVVGFSMGGLLALHLAASQPTRVAALAALGVPLWLPRRQTRLIRAVGVLTDRVAALPGGRRLLVRLPVVPKQDGKSDLRDPDMRQANPTMPAMPLRGLVQLERLAQVARAGLERVTAPAFVAHGGQDHTAPPECADELMARLGSRVRVRLRLPESYHLIPLDVERGKLADALADFMSAELSRTS